MLDPRGRDQVGMCCGSPGEIYMSALNARYFCFRQASRATGNGPATVGHLGSRAQSVTSQTQLFVFRMLRAIKCSQVKVTMLPAALEYAYLEACGVLLPEGDPP